MSESSNQPRPESPGEKPASTTGEKPASATIESIKLDFATIRIIILTACVVAALLCVPLFFILRNFVTFDALDHYLKVTEAVRPKILQGISEEVSTGYSKNFFFNSTSEDNTVLFLAHEKQRVTLSVDEVPIEGPFQPVLLQVNGCDIGARSPEGERSFHLYEYDLTTKIQQCAPDEPNLHTLRISFSKPLKMGNVIQVRSLIIVYERLREHLEGAR